MSNEDATLDVQGMDVSGCIDYLRTMTGVLEFDADALLLPDADQARGVFEVALGVAGVAGQLANLLEAEEEAGEEPHVRPLNRDQLRADFIASYLACLGELRRRLEAFRDGEAEFEDVRQHERAVLRMARRRERLELAMEPLADSVEEA
jgi:hypothetical protein